MSQARLVQLLALIGCGAFLFASASISPRINQGRDDLNMIGTESVQENTPPEYAFAIQAFGAFRSLITDIAFIRAEQLKEEGRYYDAMQLANWICKLQPRFPSVWEFHSWNMAWNISVTTYTHEERWNWVYNGVKLLRDEALKFNPRAANIYKQLAWTYTNKMGEPLDEFHWTYKRMWAFHMHLLLGAPPPGLGEYDPDAEFEPLVFDATEDPVRQAARITAERNDLKREMRARLEGTPFRTRSTAEERAERGVEVKRFLPFLIEQKTAYEHIQEIHAAPTTLDELVGTQPETVEMLARLRELGLTIDDEPLDEDAYWREDGLASRFFQPVRQLLDPRSIAADIERGDQLDDQPAETLRDRIDAILGLRAKNPSGLAVLRFLQRKVLAEVYKLDTEHMLYVIENFGPVDWRGVDTHALYWVTLGLTRSGETYHSFHSDKTNTVRIIFFALRNLFQKNNIIFEPDYQEPVNSYINLSPDANFIGSMHEAYMNYGPLIDPDPGEDSGAGAIFRTGHTNFLGEAIRMLYFSDREEEAQYYYDFLRTTYGRHPDGSPKEEYAVSLRDFVIRSHYGAVDGSRETARAINDLLDSGYEALARGETTRYNRLVDKALDLHRTYMQERVEQQGPRMKLPPFTDMQIDRFGLFFMQPAFDSIITVHKARLWRIAPDDLRRSVYDFLIEGLTAECEAWDFDVAKAFPEPPGMEQYRKENPVRRILEQPERTADPVPGG